MVSRHLTRSVFLASLLGLVAVTSVWLGPRPTTSGDLDSVEAALSKTAELTPVSSRSDFEPVDGAPVSAVPDRPRVPVWSGLPERINRAQPVRVRVPALGVDAPVVPTGVTTTGQMEVPTNVRDVAWYRYGPAPGEGGSTVLAAHVDLAGQGPGVFFYLHTLEVGDVVVVELSDGQIGRYQVEAITRYKKDELPIDVVFSREGPPVLTLVTCGGGFSQGRYDSNVVVYAVPAEVSGAS